jgi:predicted GIY-YIG superfamily endonuclease
MRRYRFRYNKGEADQKWNRACKLELIEAQNPDWKDLWDDI